MSKGKIAGGSLANFQKRLLAWYGRNKRTMPWRGTRDAYRVWVSEIMLQQTRVAAVLPYYRRLMRRFPTVRALARARSEDVLRHWAGLGYYSRARNLHCAAKEIVARHGGRFPREYDAALALPGVGRYTAAAVLSIVYGEPLAVVDGNVARVVARLGAVRGNVRANGRWRKLEERAQELMKSGEWRVASGEKKQKAKIEKRNTKNGEARRHEEVRKGGSEERKGPAEAARQTRRRGGEWLPDRLESLSYERRQDAGGTEAGEWNQAMMELGATVCTPRAPRCGECPVAPWCEARRLGTEEEIPFARKRRAAERVEIAAAVMVDARGRTLLVKPSRAETNGLFSGMWQFPVLETKNEERRKRGREEGKFKGVKGEWEQLDEVRHTVTFREVRVRPYLVRVEKLPDLRGARVVRLEKLEGMAISSATKKIARVAAEECCSGLALAKRAGLRNGLRQR